MKKPVVKVIGLFVVSILILALATISHINEIPSELYTTRDEVSEAMACFPEIGPFNSLKYKDKKLNINFLGLIPIKEIAVNKVDNIELVPGGTSIGVKLSSDGILVVGFSDVVVDNNKIESPAKEAGIEIGDLILKVNGSDIGTSKELIDVINSLDNNNIDLEIRRENEIIHKEISLIKEDDKKFKIGLWVRDSTAGVGTLTFYHEESGKFAALGHPVTDVDTNKCFTIKNGQLIQASVISVRKGEKGAPGELKGIFVEANKPIGTISKNTQCGIFGTYKGEVKNNLRAEKMQVGFRDEIKIGKASIITTIDERGPKEYEIEIMKLFQQDQPGSKSMLIKVTDKELLEKTGGIVQGMSGSPIIQNGKIIGAVTHVLINKPDVGYGIYIDWMLTDAGIIE